MIFESKCQKPIGNLGDAILPEELVSYFENNLHRYEQKLKEVVALKNHEKAITQNKIVLSNHSTSKH